MADAGIPKDIRDFLGQHISTIEQLEILLFLYRQPGKACSGDTVAQQLGLAHPLVARCLDDLKKSGQVCLVAPQQGLYQACSDNEPQLQFMHRLAQIYSERRVTIINLIFSRHLDRIRAFADSFKLTKRDPDG